MSLNQREVSYLVAALLNVNNYGMARALDLMPAFETAKLLDPEAMHAIEVDELKRQIEAAGYRRGGYIPVIAGRMYTLMTAINEGRLDGLAANVAAGDRAAFVAALTGVYGWGPRTADTAWLLWST